MLLPPSFKECLPPDHFCFMVNDIVDGLDLSIIESTFALQAKHDASRLTFTWSSYGKKCERSSTLLMARPHMGNEYGKSSR